MRSPAAQPCLPTGEETEAQQGSATFPRALESSPARALCCPRLPGQASQAVYRKEASSSSGT